MVEEEKKVWRPKFKYEYVIVTSKRISSPLDLIKGDVTYLITKETEIK